MDIPSSINQAKAAAFVGDTRTALVILKGVITQDPGNVDAWLALADIVEKPEQAKECLDSRIFDCDAASEDVFGKDDQVGAVFGRLFEEGRHAFDDRIG